MGSNKRFHERIYEALYESELNLNLCYEFKDDINQLCRTHEYMTSFQDTN